MEQTKHIRIGGREYAIAPLSVATFAALLTAWPHIDALAPESFRVTPQALDAFVGAVAALVGAPRDEIMALPLDEFIDAVGNTVPAVVSEYGRYLGGPVEAAARRMSESFSAASRRIA